MTEYFCVITSYDDRGRVTSGVVDSRLCDQLPKSTCVSTRRKDIYTDWFPTIKEALSYEEDAKYA